MVKGCSSSKEEAAAQKKRNTGSDKEFPLHRKKEIRLWRRRRKDSRRRWMNLKGRTRKKTGVRMSLMLPLPPLSILLRKKLLPEQCNVLWNCLLSNS
jgi:hypothetical protein